MKRLTGSVFDGTPNRPWCSKLDCLLMLKFPPSSIWGTKSELVSVKLELNMRAIQNSLSQRCHSFCFSRCTRAGWKWRRQGQRHVRSMSWRQSAVQRNSEREDGIALRYYWKNNLAHGWNAAYLNIPFNLSCFVTILNTFSVSWITIPERPKRQGFLLWRTEVYNVSKDKIIASCTNRLL